MNESVHFDGADNFSKKRKLQRVGLINTQMHAVF